MLVCSCKFFEKLDLCARHHRKLKPAVRRYCVLSTVSRRYPSSSSVALKKVRLLLWCGAVKVNAFLTVAEHTWAAACSIAVPRDWRSVENCCVNLWTVDDSVIRGVSGEASQWEAILGSCVLSQSSFDRIFDCSGFLTIFSENFERIFFLYRRKCIFKVVWCFPPWLIGTGKNCISIQMKLKQLSYYWLITTSTKSLHQLGWGRNVIL